MFHNFVLECSNKIELRRTIKTGMPFAYNESLGFYIKFTDVYNPKPFKRGGEGNYPYDALMVPPPYPAYRHQEKDEYVLHYHNDMGWMVG